MEFITAIAIGIMGSLHCVGMCGPIALALPLDRSNSLRVFLGSSIYNLGRMFTYFLLGLLFGSIGIGVSFLALQEGVSILIGVIMILSVIIPFSKQINKGIFYSLLGRLKSSLGKRLQKKSYVNLFLIGLLNGLLPCGLVYMAILGAIAMATPLNGGLFMLFFGLGTFPLMLGVNLFGNRLKGLFYPSFKKLIPVFIVLLGSLFILRGLGLGIPYISPSIHPTAEVVECH